VGPIEAAARAALAGHGGDDAVERMRLEVVYRAARLMDAGPAHLFKQSADVLRQTVIDLIGHAEPKDGETAVLQDFVASIQSSRRGKPTVRDAEESGT
jgi:hypothetical protein